MAKLFRLKNPILVPTLAKVLWFKKTNPGRAIEVEKTSPGANSGRAFEVKKPNPGVNPGRDVEVNKPVAVQILVNTRPPRLLRLKNRPNPGANPGANAGATPGQYKAVEINKPT